MYPVNIALYIHVHVPIVSHNAVCLLSCVLYFVPCYLQISTEANTEARSLEKRDEEERGKVGTSDGEKRDEAREETPGKDPTLPRGDTPSSVSQLPPSMAPFPHLHTLSLANNLVNI